MAQGHRISRSFKVVCTSEMLRHTMSDSALRSAILSQKDKMIKKLLDEGADVDDADNDGVTSLHVASKTNSSKIVQSLLSWVVYTTRTSREQTHCPTLLHYAIVKGHKEIVQFLLSNNADANVRTWDGKSELHIAAERKYMDIARVPLSHGASVNSPSSFDYGHYNNFQPLHCAVANGHDELVKLLIDNGADVNADAVNVSDDTSCRHRCEKEWTPLHIAVEKGYIGITKTLLEHGADVNAGKYNQLISPLCVAMKEFSYKGSILPCVQPPSDKEVLMEYTEYEIITNLLLDHGAVFVPEISIFQEVMSKAMALRNTTTVERILTSFPDTMDSFRYVRRNNCTLLHIAADFWNVKLVEFLIRHGADVNAKDSRGQTPLFYVVQNNDKILFKDRKSRGDDLKTAELLLSNGANVDCKNVKMKTPLYHAVEADNNKMVQFLVTHNACVNSHVDCVMSPLHVAVMQKNAEIAEILLNNGARINSVCFKSCVSFSSDLDNPHSDADSQGSLDHCPSTASYVSNDPAGRRPILFMGSATPLDCAVEEGHKKFVKLLLSKMISDDTNSANNSKPMCSAISNGHHRILKLLLDHGFYIDVNDKEIKEALFTTARYGYVKTLEHIFKSYPEVNVIVNNIGRTLFHHAVIVTGVDLMDCGKVKEVAKLLLKHRCDLNALDDYGITPLVHAFNVFKFHEDDHLDVVKYFLEHGACVDPTDKHLHTVINYLMRRDCHKLIELLLKHCSDVKMLLHANGIPLLHTAIDCGYKKGARLLIRYGADPNATNEGGENALRLAMFDPEAVEMLLERGADVDGRFEDGKTALLIAACPIYGVPSQVVTVLLNYGADVNITCTHNRTALDYVWERSAPGDKTKNLITKHLIKMKAANLFVNEHDLQSIGLCDSYNDLYNSCKAEYEEMRKTKIADTSLCYHHILSGINCARNESVVKTLESRGYETKFPLYTDWIKNSFERAQKRVNLLNRIPTASNALLGHELPTELSMKIFGCLSNFDLQNFIEAYKNDTSEKLYEKKQTEK